MIPQHRSYVLRFVIIIPWLVPRLSYNANSIQPTCLSKGKGKLPQSLQVDAISGIQKYIWIRSRVEYINNYGETGILEAELLSGSKVNHHSRTFLLWHFQSTYPVQIQQQGYPRA